MVDDGEDDWEKWLDNGANTEIKYDNEFKDEAFENNITEQSGDKKKKKKKKKEEDANQNAKNSSDPAKVSAEQQSREADRQNIMDLFGIIEEQDNLNLEDKKKSSNINKGKKDNETDQKEESKEGLKNEHNKEAPKCAILSDNLGKYSKNTIMNQADENYESGDEDDKNAHRAAPLITSQTSEIEYHQISIKSQKKVKTIHKFEKIEIEIINDKTKKVLATIIEPYVANQPVKILQTSTDQKIKIARGVEYFYRIRAILKNEESTYWDDEYTGEAYLQQIEHYIYFSPYYEAYIPKIEKYEAASQEIIFYKQSITTKDEHKYKEIQVAVRAKNQKTDTLLPQQAFTSNLKVSDFQPKNQNEFIFGFRAFLKNDEETDWTEYYEILNNKLQIAKVGYIE